MLLFISEFSISQMDAHIKDVCPRTIIPCKYGYLNCKEKVIVVLTS